MKFYEHRTNGLIYYLQCEKVFYFERGMRWSDALESGMHHTQFPLAIATGELKEVGSV